jgi:hypothetical protein
MKISPVFPSEYDKQDLFEFSFRVWAQQNIIWPVGMPQTATGIALAYNYAKFTNPHSIPNPSQTLYGYEVDLPGYGEEIVVGGTTIKKFMDDEEDNNYALRA